MKIIVKIYHRGSGKVTSHEWDDVPFETFKRQWKAMIRASIGFVPVSYKVIYQKG